MRRSLRIENKSGTPDKGSNIDAADPSPVVTKVRTRWLENGKNEGALMTLNLRELRDEAKRLGFESTVTKTDSKDKFASFLHKTYSSGREIEKSLSKENQISSDMETDSTEESEIVRDINESKPKGRKRKETVKKGTTSKAKLSNSNTSTAKLAAAAASAISSVLTSRSGPAIGNRKSKKKDNNVNLSENEREALGNIEVFFASELPENDWSCVEELECLPVIKVGNVFLKYPCDESFCKELIKECSQAPFGKGSETVLDTSVRKTWEADSSKVNIMSKPWLDLFSNSKDSSVLKSIKMKMAPKCKMISAKFHKLLVYEPGSFFKPHKDTQRDANHFASIVVFLPSYFSGGELLVRHGNNERKFSFSYLSEVLQAGLLKCHAVSFFTDCEHEVTPVVSGYRVALTYNLFVKTQNDIPSVPLPMSEAECKMEDMITSAFQLKSFKEKKLLSLGVILQHEYAILSLKPEFLKGNDKIIYDAVTKNGKFEVELTPISVEAQGQGDGDDEDDDPFGAAKVCYDFTISDGYDINFSIRRRNVQHLIEREERRRQEREMDDFDDDYEDEQSNSDEDIFFDKQGELLSEFTWNGEFQQTRYVDYLRETEIPRKGSVYFVSDWRKIAIGKIQRGEAIPTGNEGTEFELQYLAAAMLIKPKH